MSHLLTTYADERDRYKALLEEAVDWLCTHDEDARAAWKNGAGRAWCSRCCNYIRSEEELTLAERVRAALS